VVGATAVTVAALGRPAVRLGFGCNVLTSMGLGAGRMRRMLRCCSAATWARISCATSLGLVSGSMIKRYATRCMSRSSRSGVVVVPAPFGISVLGCPFGFTRSDYRTPPAACATPPVFPDSAIGGLPRLALMPQILALWPSHAAICPMPDAGQRTGPCVCSTGLQPCRYRVSCRRTLFRMCVLILLLVVRQPR
jgi:hypothetical protein